MMGTAAKGNIALQNQIKDTRHGVVGVLQKIAHSMGEAYGILITSPDQLREYLG
jgi:hypothetical protein